MSIDIAALTKNFQKAPLPAFIAVLISAIIWLAIENKTLAANLVNVHEAARQEIALIEKRCAYEKDDLRQQQIQFVNAALERLQRLEDQARAAKKLKQ